MASSQILGCAQSYTCLVTQRGGGHDVGQLENVGSIQWDRKLSAGGTAVVSMGAARMSAQCCRLMNLLSRDESMRAYELHVYRDSSKVWCGPILKVSETRGPTDQSFVINAKDILSYLDTYGHWLQQGYNISADVVDIAVRVLGADLATDDPSIGANIVSTPAGITVNRAAAAYSASVLSEINALVASGLRYTTVVRTLYLGGLRGTPFGAPIQLSVDQVAGDVTIEHDGTAYCNTVYGSSGNATAQVPAGSVPATDPQLVVVGRSEPGWRGRVETGVSSSGGTNGQGSVVAAAQAAYFSARRPRVLRVADNSVVSPTATVTVPGLVPGTVVKLAGAGRFCTWVAEDLQLVRVSGSFGAQGERIGISLGPVG